MNDPNASKSQPSATPTAKPEDGSTTRLAVLLGVLGIGLMMLGYDWMFLTPACNANFDKLEKLVEEKNRQGVKSDGGKTAADAFLVTDKDVHGLLGKPTSVVDKKHYFEEWYCGWGVVPIRRNYIVVAYQKGKEGGPNRHHSHYKNNSVQDPPTDTSKVEAVKVDPNAKPMTPEGPSSLPPTRPSEESTDEPKKTTEDPAKTPDEPKTDEPKTDEPKKEETKDENSKTDEKTPASKTEEGAASSDDK